jgi:hypothetical protein
MKRILLISLLLFVGATAQADDASDLMGLGMPGELASQVATGMDNGVFSASVAAGTTVTAGTGVTATTGGVTATAGNITATAGDVVITATGKTIKMESGTAASACIGTGTYNGTTAVTISTTCAVTGAKIFTQDTSDPAGSTAAQCWATNISNGVSFDVDCDQANDATFNWLIIKEAP